MSEPKISLVIPAYNEEKYIGECLDSVIKNSNGNFFEIIVVDNGSTDRTKDIAEKKGAKVVVENKKGVVSARQKGYKESKGDIIAFIDADSRIPKGWCENATLEFQNNPNLATLSGPYIYYDVSLLKKVSVWFYWHFLAMPAYFLIGYMQTGGNFVIKKSVLEKMSGFDTTIEFYGEDTNTARRASEFGKVKFKLDFYLYTSGRRLLGEGTLKIAILYMINFLSEVLIHRPVTKTYRDIR